MKLTAHFDYSQLDHTQNNTAHLVVSLEAPSIDWISQRPKICVFPVIDISGSMAGSKIDYAKSSVRKLVEQLTSGDFAGLAVFDSKFEVLVPPQEVTPEVKERLLQAIEKIVTRGSTNYSDTLEQSLRIIQDLDLPPSFLHRVIFFTDGQPTAGIVDQKALKDILTKGLGRATVSFFGYGESGNAMFSACDHGFLTEMSQLGKGNYAYVQNPDDSLAAFGKELGGLLSTYGSNVKISLASTKGHVISKVVTNVSHEQDVGEMILDVGDILAEEKRHFVFEVELQEQKNAFPRDTKIVDVEATFMQVTQGGKEAGKLETDAKVRFVRKNDAQAKPDPELDKIVALHQMVRAQIEAEEQAKKGAFNAAQEIMDKTSNSFRLRGQDGIAAAAARTGVVLGNSVDYVSQQGYLRSMQYASRGTSASAMTADASALLADIGVSMNNAAQEAYTSAFVAPTPPNQAEWKVALSTTTPPSTKGG